MTGFGEARSVDDRLTVIAELRAVNNRHLKLNARISDPFSALEPDFERLIRETIRRGTIQFSLRVERPRRAEDYRLNLVALSSYRDQVVSMLGPGSPPPDLAALLGLPGVVEGRNHQADDPREEWPKLAQVVGEAVEKLQASRAEEGRAMASELLSLARLFAGQLDHVARRGPEIVSAYQSRLIERVQALVKDRVTIEPKDLIREVAILAERADIAEEIVRLRAHLQQFEAVIAEPESAGRKLEFVVQEMGRETNTIGSKANDVEISRSVVEMKGLLEKIRELILNIE